jgi:hypothetical protein
MARKRQEREREKTYAVSDLIKTETLLNESGPLSKSGQQINNGLLSTTQQAPILGHQWHHLECLH